MTIFLVFFLVVLAVFLIIFSSEALSDTYGTTLTVWLIGVVIFLFTGFYLIGRAIIG